MMLGVYEKGEFKSGVTVDGKQVKTKEYQLWEGMLRRCYCEKLQQRCPTYIGCSVSENFKNFQWFAEWCQSQVGFRMHGCQLDKDILLRGNKQYSEDTCVFVPRNINMLLIKRQASRGDLPIGVHWCNTGHNYRASCSDGAGSSKHIGRFTTPSAAFNAYKPFKEALIKRLAAEYQSVIDPRVYDALMAYEVFITD